MIEQHFGESPLFSLGIEEEIMILDAETLMPAAAVERLISTTADGDMPGVLKTELHASVVELNTGVCADAAAAVDAIRTLRRHAAEGADELGLRIAAAGSHPRARPEDLEIVQEPRYLEFVEYAGVSARRQGVNGLHVHIGMPGPEECIHVLDGVLPWLPLVLAMSANSPYIGGDETGLMSARAEILSLLPRRGPPPPLESYGDWERLIERLVVTGLVKDYTSIWWDARVHPRFGTLEIRAPDQPTSLDVTLAFVALLQAMCALALSEPRRPADPGSRVVYDQNRWAAARYGSQARLIHPDNGRAVAASELGGELLDRIAPHARELGTEELVARLDPASCEGERQLDIGRRDGLEAVCGDLVERTLDFGWIDG